VCVCVLSQVKDRHCNSTLARKTGPEPVMWRCYPSSELSPNGTWITGHGACYCSRDAEIRDVLAKCGDPDPDVCLCRPSLNCASLLVVVVV
jgi:hypothetical protein